MFWPPDRKREMKIDGFVLVSGHPNTFITYRGVVTTHLVNSSVMLVYDAGLGL